MEIALPGEGADFSSLTFLEREELGMVEELPIDVQRMLAFDPRVEVRLSFLLGSRTRDREVIRQMELAEVDPDLLVVLRDQTYASPGVKRLLFLDMIKSRDWLDVVCEELAISESVKSTLWKERSTFAATHTTFGEALDRLLQSDRN